MDIIGKRKIWYGLSLILIIPGVLALIFWGLPLGIDFRGGTLLEISFEAKPAKTEINNALEESQLQNFHLQETTNGFLIRSETINPDQQTKVKENLQKIGDYQIERLETVGPTVSQNLKKKAIYAIGLATLAIIFYIAFSFRQVPRPASSWKFGVAAVVALIHDVLFVTGLFAILGHFGNLEIDSLFITAILTIMGFSVHDTIVVFDRIRENLRRAPSLDFDSNVNQSILQTLNRSLNTSFTVLIVLLALYLLGGQTLKNFMLALLVGIAIGTYSSIFNAPPILTSWQGWSLRRAKKNLSS